MKKKIKVAYEASYCLSHEPTYREKEIWIIFHGYGQLAEFFIRKFIPFDTEDRLFLAPEATNYSYLKVPQGRVGANWMTSHERELAIENNHRYLDQLVNEHLEKFETPPAVHVFGFSQGVATATRWASRWQGNVQKFVLWAGGFAHDMNVKVSNEKFGETEFISVLGDQDEFVTSEILRKQEELVEALKMDVKKITFQGGHLIDSEVLNEIFEKN
ncbi:alpha/beta hydrolase [Algoriphagus aestuarii]|nr:alpha/beta hydrolase [Algoriphagus aestuarii]